ncbi:MAG TPA: hypothetical protein VFY45_05640, partial [Baekduia sp.]|nr:hypothetical protein [Baekduia sp.]
PADSVGLSGRSGSEDRAKLAQGGLAPLNLNVVPREHAPVERPHHKRGKSLRPRLHHDGPVALACPRPPLASIELERVVTAWSKPNRPSARAAKTRDRCHPCGLRALDIGLDEARRAGRFCLGTGSR